MCCGTEVGSYLRLIDSCITQLKAQGPSRTCNESKEEEEEEQAPDPSSPRCGARAVAHALSSRPAPHPTPSTLHPTPHALHPTPYTEAGTWAFKCVVCNSSCWACSFISPCASLITPSRLLSFISATCEDGRCKTTWEREFKLPWREAGPPNHHKDKVDSDQQVVNKELSLFTLGGSALISLVVGVERHSSLANKGTHRP